MKITITRSFERTRQIADFVPVKAFCQATMEVDCESPSDYFQTNASQADSRLLDNFVQSEVEKTLMGYKPCCVTCGGKEIVGGKGLNKEGVCKTCEADYAMKLRDAKADNQKNEKVG
jgi:hypothetical protein